MSECENYLLDNKSGAFKGCGGPFIVCSDCRRPFCKYHHGVNLSDDWFSFGGHVCPVHKAQAARKREAEAALKAAMPTGGWFGRARPVVPDQLQAAISQARRVGVDVSRAEARLQATRREAAAAAVASAADAQALESALHAARDAGVPDDVLQSGHERLATLRDEVVLQYSRDLVDALRNAATADALHAAIQRATPRAARLPLVANALPDAHVRLEALQRRTFGNSRFLAEYRRYSLPLEDPDRLAEIKSADQVFAKVTEFLDAYCRVHGLTSAALQVCHTNFLEKLKLQTAQHPELASLKRVLGRVGATAELLWTSDVVFDGAPAEHASRFYVLLNRATREDQPELAPSVAGFARALNVSLLVARHRSDAARQRFPPQSRTWRGGGFGLDGVGADHWLSPPSLRAFFTEGKKYRVPGFMATSFDKRVADGFRRDAANTERVLWIVHFDPRGDRQHDEYDESRRCKHVNFISHSHVVDEHGNPREAEYLFAPYSVFTIRAVQWGTGERPLHTIELVPAADNQHESEDLELAPWY